MPVNPAPPLPEIEVAVMLGAMVAMRHRRSTLKDEHVGSYRHAAPQSPEHAVRKSHAAVGGLAADRRGLVSAMDQDAVAQVERISAEVIPDHTARGVRRPHPFPNFAIPPVRLSPNAIVSLPDHS